MEHRPPQVAPIDPYAESYEENDWRAVEQNRGGGGPKRLQDNPPRLYRGEKDTDNSMSSQARQKRKATVCRIV